MPRGAAAADLLGEVEFTRRGIAGHYDELPLWSAPFGQLVLDRVPLRRGQAILDIGAGTGFLSVELAQRSGPDSSVVAVDPWADALDVLAERCAFLGLTNVVAQCRDAATLELPDASIDVAVSNLGINNFDDPPAVLREVQRVLRHDGTLVMSSNLMGHFAEFYAVFADALTAAGRADRLPVLQAHMAGRATVEGTVELLGAAGLRTEDVTTGSFTMRYADGTALLRHWFIRLGFRQAWAEVADEPADPSSSPVFAELVRGLDVVAEERGCLELTVPTACFTAVPAP